MRRFACASGLTTTTFEPFARSASTCSATDFIGPKPTTIGARITTRSRALARSAFTAERMPPSIHFSPPMLTGGHTPGTAQLAATASTRDTPSLRSNTRNSPVRALTAVSLSARSGHSCEGSRDAMTARRAASSMVFAPSARLPIAWPSRSGSRFVTIAHT